jgi:hypothetical protein
MPCNRAWFFIFHPGRILPLARQDRALRLYLFCLRQKRIPLQSLALL